MTDWAREKVNNAIAKGFGYTDDYDMLMPHAKSQVSRMAPHIAKLLRAERARSRRMMKEIKQYASWFHKSGCKAVIDVVVHDNSKCTCGLVQLLRRLG